MYTNYHAHTARCYHAYGTEEEFILRAIDAGFSEFGFSDHAPYLFNGFFSNFRMEPDKLKDYVDTIQALRKKYADEIKIYVGLEMEYYPAHFDDTLRFVINSGVEYLILGQHFTNNEYDGVHVTHGSDVKKEHLLQYVNQVLCAIDTGVFTYIAHPDTIDYNTKSPEYADEMYKICVAAKKANLPLEINLLGFVTNRHYPSYDFLKLAADCGNDVIIGFDAHSVNDVFSPRVESGIEQIKALTKELGLKLLDRVEPKKLTL